MAITELESDTWKLFIDGVKNAQGAGVGITLISPKGKEFIYALKFDFKLTNNKVEYEALVAGLKLSIKLQVSKIHIKGDSQLVINQVNGNFQAKEERMKEYLKKVKELMEKFDRLKVDKIFRRENAKADSLARLASTIHCKEPRTVPIELVTIPSIALVESHQVQTVEEVVLWMDPIKRYLDKRDLPKERS